MVRYIILYLITLGLFFAIDLTWLGLVAKNLYKEKLGFIMSPDINWPAAISFYLIFIVGILYFSILPAINAQSVTTAIINGAFLGFLCYATYDLTNMATIAKWPLSIVIIDMVWGAVLTCACSVGTFYIARMIYGS